MDRSNSGLWYQIPYLSRVGRLFRPNPPPQDYALPIFDDPKHPEANQVYLVLSTPRTGSTYLSELLFRNRAGLPHEYFHESEYLITLSQRWGAWSGGKVNIPTYLRALTEQRTGAAGALGIGLHGRHIPTFLEFAPYLEIPVRRIFVLKRRDFAAQVSSYATSLATNSWSSHWTGRPVRQIGETAIRLAIKSLMVQNQLVDYFAKQQEGEVQEIFYEDLANNPGQVLELFREFAPPQSHWNLRSSMTKQRTTGSRDIQSALARVLAQSIQEVRAYSLLRKIL